MVYFKSDIKPSCIVEIIHLINMYYLGAQNWNLLSNISHWIFTFKFNNLLNQAYKFIFLHLNFFELITLASNNELAKVQLCFLAYFVFCENIVPWVFGTGKLKIFPLERCEDEELW